MSVVSKIIIGVVSLIAVLVLSITAFGNMHQLQQTTTTQMNQITSQLNDDSVNLINACETDQSVASLTMCKSGISDMKSKCQDPQYSSMSVCTDPRIDQFLSTVDNKIAYAQTQISSAASKLNGDMSKTVDDCSQINDPNGISMCKSEMMQIQQECISMGANAVPACNDARIVQIMNKQITQPSNLYDAASQTMESFINLCMMSQDNNAIQDCATKARQMISLCQSASVTACSDPRLSQIANMGQNTNPTQFTNMSRGQALNSLNGQTVNPTTSTTDVPNSCPASSTKEVMISKSSTGNSLFNPQTLDLHGGDIVIFKSSDKKPHILTSNNADIRDWFSTNGGLIDDTNSINFPITIFGDNEKFFTVFDSYEPNISITLDVKPTPTECSK